MSLETITRPPVTTSPEPPRTPDARPTADLSRALARISQALRFRTVLNDSGAPIAQDGSHLNEIWPLMTPEWLRGTSARIAAAEEKMRLQRIAVEAERNLCLQEKQANT